jgi:hypothetical protein
MSARVSSLSSRRRIFFIVMARHPKIVMARHPKTVMARRVRATYRGTVLIQVARIHRAMTVLGCRAMTITGHDDKKASLSLSRMRITA